MNLFVFGERGTDSAGAQLSRDSIAGERGGGVVALVGKEREPGVRSGNGARDFANDTQTIGAVREVDKATLLRDVH